METSDSLGSILKKEREKRGLGLQEVFDATRITTQNLAALEEDRFDYFPNKVYSRAFLRDYANFLGLDSSLLLARYEDDWTKPLTPEQVPTPQSQEKSGSKAWVVVVVVILLAAACAAGLYYKTMLANRSGLPENPPEARTTEDDPGVNVATVPKAPAVTAEDESASVPSETPTEPPAEDQQPAVTDKVVLEITAKGALWVRVQIDDNPKAAFMNVMQAGQTLQWSGAQKVSVRVARGNAADIKLNGVALPPLGTEEAPANGKFTMEDVKRVTGAAETPAPSPTPGTTPPAEPR